MQVAYARIYPGNMFPNEFSLRNLKNLLPRVKFLSNLAACLVSLNKLRDGEKQSSASHLDWRWFMDLENSLNFSTLKYNTEFIPVITFFSELLQSRLASLLQ